MNKTRRTQIAQQLRAAAQKLSATKVKAASGKKVVKPGKLGSAGIWEDEVVAETMSLTDILEGLDQDHLAKIMSDTMGNFDSDFVPDAGEIANQNRSKVPDEAITIFADAAGNAYRSAWENAAEGYFVKTVIENVIELLDDASGEAQYDATDSNGDEVSVQVPFDVTAKETGDIDGIFSNPYIEVTISNPGHLVNYVESVLGYQGGEPVDEPVAAVGTSALGSLLSMLKSESRAEVKNLGDVNTDHADMDWAHFAELFNDEVLNLRPDDIAEAIQTYANAQRSRLRTSSTW